MLGCVKSIILAQMVTEVLLLDQICIDYCGGLLAQLFRSVSIVFGETVGQWLFVNGEG